MHLETGDFVFHAGDPAQSLYVVKTGRIELRDGEGKVLRNVTPGTQIGKQTLLSSKVWRFTAVAAESTKLVAVSGKVFEAVVNAGSTVEEVFSLQRSGNGAGIHVQPSRILNRPGRELASPARAKS